MKKTNPGHMTLPFPGAGGTVRHQYISYPAVLTLARVSLAHWLMPNAMEDQNASTTGKNIGTGGSREQFIGTVGTVLCAATTARGNKTLLLHIRPDAYSEFVGSARHVSSYCVLLGVPGGPTHCHRRRPQLRGVPESRSFLHGHVVCRRHIFPADRGKARLLRPVGLVLVALSTSIQILSFLYSSSDASKTVSVLRWLTPRAM